MQTIGAETESETALDNKLSFDIEESCQLDVAGNLYPELYEELTVAQRIKDNLNGSFVLISQIFILLLMFLLMAFNTFYVPSKLMPYQIPLILRGAETSDWFDRARLSNLIFALIFVLAGCIPMVGTTNFGQPCLTSTDPAYLEFK